MQKVSPPEPLLTSDSGTGRRSIGSRALETLEWGRQTIPFQQVRHLTAKRWERIPSIWERGPADVREPGVGAERAGADRGVDVLDQLCAAAVPLLFDTSTPCIEVRLAAKPRRAVLNVGAGLASDAK
jgi:hypothetical protein